MIENDSRSTLANFYPQQPPEAMLEAEENLHLYLGVVKRIFENVRKEKPEILTELRRRARLRRKARNSA